MTPTRTLEPPTILRPQGEPRRPVAPGAGVMGMTLFLISLAVLFAGSIVAYVVVRLQAESWPPAGAPALPRLLWVSTLALLGCSVTIQQALSAVRAGQSERLARKLRTTLLLALAFLGTQSWCWWSFFHAETFSEHLYAFTFYMLTGLHAAHVIGGMVLLVVVWIRMRMGAYSWAHYPGVRHAALYWHFLDAVWLILFALLLLDR